MSSLTDCCECRVHRIDYYAALAMGAEPATARRAFKAKIALCDTNGDSLLTAFVAAPLARGLDEAGAGEGA